MNEKIKAFYHKHETVIDVTAIALFSAAVVGLYAKTFKVNESIKLIKSTMSPMKVVDDLTDEEWEHLIGMARQMDEYVAERRALKAL